MSWSARLLVAGQTEKEALANIRDAIREYLIVRDELLKEGDIVQDVGRTVEEFKRRL